MSEQVRILVVGTLDTKAVEIANLAAEIRASGGEPIILDSSVGPAAAQVLSGEGHEAVAGLGADAVPYVTQAQVAAAAGTSPENIWSLPRGEAVSRMRSGITATVLRLVSEEEIDGAVCLGGAGVHLTAPAFQELGLETPKLILSPLASGSRQFEPFVGISNVAVMHTIVDVAGLNHISRTVYRQAAGYIVGAATAMRRSHASNDDLSVGLIAVSMNGNTTPLVEHIRADLAALRLNLVAFHANGTGGRAMEHMIGAGEFLAVLDITTTELAGAEVGGLMDPGTDRMEAAGRRGLPQVLVPGCLDLITAGRPDVAQQQFPGHRLFNHSPELTLVRMAAPQMERLGRVFAAKANLALGGTTICVPSQGFSIPGSNHGPFWDPEADAAFLQALIATVADHVRVRVVDAHINAPEFAAVLVEELQAVLAADGIDLEQLS